MGCPYCIYQGGPNGQESRYSGQCKDKSNEDKIKPP